MKTILLVTFLLPSFSFLSAQDFKKETQLDESRYFFSKRDRRILLRELSQDVQFQFQEDSLTIKVFLRGGEELLKRGDFKDGLKLFKLAHDLSKVLKRHTDLAVSYNNLGFVYKIQGQYKQAFQEHMKAIEIQELLGQEVYLATSYNNMGFLYFSQGKYEDALLWYNKAQEIRKRLDLEVELSIGYNNIGEVYRSQGKYEKALSLFNEALEIQGRFDLKNYQATTYNNIGETYRNQGQYEKALKWFNKAREIREILGLEFELAINYNNIGETYRSQGYYKEALKWYHNALEIFTRKGLEVYTAKSYNNIAEAYRSQGKYEEALKNYNKAREIRERLDLEVDLAGSCNNLGNVYLDKGQYDQALIWYNKARNIEERLGRKINMAITYNNIGTVYRFLSQFERALLWYDKSREIREEMNIEIDLGNSYGNLGSVYHHQGQYENALNWYSKARDIQERLGLEVNLAMSYNNIGAVYGAQGKYKEALQNYNMACEIQKRLDLEPNLATTFNNIGSCYFNQKQYQEALNWYNKAKQTRERLGLDLDLVSTYINICLAYYKNGNYGDSFIYTGKAIQLNDLLRSGNRSQLSRQVFVQIGLSTIEIGLISGFQLSKLDSAFLFSEKGKARGFLDLMTERGIDLNTLNIPQELSRAYADNANQLKTLNQNLTENIEDDIRQKLILRRDNLFNERQELEGQIRLIAPAYANLVYPETVDDKQVQPVLQENEVLISFFMGEVKTYAFIITSNQLKMVDLGEPDSLVQEFRERVLLKKPTGNILIQKKYRELYVQKAHQLYQKLWQPLEATGLLKDKHVLLVPDGILNYLPFELLVNGSTSKAFNELNYLIKEYPITYYPSATVLHFERTREKESINWNKDFWGLAVSDFEENGCGEEGKIQLSNLDNSISEVNEIAQQFPTKKIDVLIESDAGESFLKTSDLTSYRYLHFSTHGLINPDQPDFSRILLNPTEGEDGCLNLFEIFNLDFNADLVSLSACETGLGQLVRGEGMVGFTRALMYAGTPSVILSLWEVVDASTKDLFVKYYSKLAKDKYSDKYTPLREAQLEMIKKWGGIRQPLLLGAFYIYWRTLTENP